MTGRLIKLQEAAGSYQARMQEFEQLREETMKREAEKRRQERIKTLVDMVPLRFRHKSLADYEITAPAQSQVKHIAMRYVDSFKERLQEGSSLIMHGNPGTGKTLLSLIMYQALAQQGFNVCYKPSLDFIHELIETKFKSQSAYQQHLRMYLDIHFLVLDEVTQSVSKGGVPSDQEKQVLFQLINQRYENNLCTVVITNRDKEELTKCLSLPIVDRLLERGVTLTFDWQSYRQR